MEVCLNCTNAFTQDYKPDDWIISREFCHSCNRNLNLSIMMTNYVSGIRATEFLFCVFINELSATRIFDLSEYKDITHDNREAE